MFLLSLVFLIMGQTVLVNKVSLNRSYLKWIIEYVRMEENAIPTKVADNLDEVHSTAFIIHNEQTVQTKSPERKDQLTHLESNDSRLFQNHPFFLSPNVVPSTRMRNPAIAILACKRPSMVIQLLNSLISLPSIGEFSLYVSFGCPESLSSLVYTNYSISFLHYHDPETIKTIPHPFLRIQLHYQSVLKELFEQRNHSHVIILEDDLGLSPDLLNFYKQTSQLLEADPTLVCVSAFNDHAQGENMNPVLLKRTSSFPNLGLMFHRYGYDVLWYNQPLADTTNGWDHWLRIRAASLHMECIYPVTPRIRHLVSINSSTTSKAFSMRLASYPIVTETVDLGDLSYLLKSNYDRSLLQFFVDPIQHSHILSQMNRPYRSALASQVPLPVPQVHFVANNMTNKEVVIIDGRNGKEVTTALKFHNRVILIFTLREVESVSFLKSSGFPKQLDDSLCFHLPVACIVDYCGLVDLTLKSCLLIVEMPGMLLLKKYVFFLCFI